MSRIVGWNWMLCAGVMLFSWDVRPAAAQVLYGWGHPVHYTPATYGAGYVGAPGWPAATTYYRAPQLGYGYSVPTTVNYGGVAPAPVAVAPVSNATNFAAAGPVVANTSYYAPVSGYPAQTVMPVQYAAPVTAYRPDLGMAGAYPTSNWGVQAPTNYAVNYATPNFYRTNYARTPVTYYRPVLVADPYTGSATTVLQPARGYAWQTQRQQTYRLFPLFDRNRTTAAAAPCANGYCGTVPAAVPYYQPSTVVPAQPASIAPSLNTPLAPATSPASGGFFPSGPTTITPPATFTPGTSFTPGSGAGVAPGSGFAPGTVVAPGTGSVPPASTAPSLGPSEFRSGASRADYPPPTESYRTPAPTNSSPPVLLSPPALDSAPSLGRELDPISEPANQPPQLVDPPAGNSLGSGTRTEAAAPRAEIRRDWTIIPDPEAKRESTSQPPTGVKAPPQLLRTDDRTAQTTLGQKAFRTTSSRTSLENDPANGAGGYRIFGDDAWKPAAK